METFLFTDIQSSTRLWEEHPHEMPGALGRHDEILAQSIADAAGHLLKTTGDGAIAVFDSPQDAIAAAQGAQGHIRNEEWGPTGTLQVRMGIHTGDTERRDGDYFGPEMNRAARIMAAGHGGQILLSERTANLVRSAMPTAAGNLRDLGTHRLKDLTAPEHLYQLVTPGLEADFPALRTLDSRPNNLPLQATEFLGREDELNSISAMLESPSVRLLTIAGPGGAGKTRLGLQVAAEQSDSFTDGVFFVDLAAAREPDTAFEAIVQTLGFPTGGSDAISVLKSRLRDQQMLLVLDNFEQITAAAPGVADLLQNAPDLRIVVTSRETLRIRGEHVFTVPPMSLPNPKHTVAEIAQAEAVQLFVERARSARADFALDEENAAAVAEICLRLDGLPLAIELAAARLNIFSPQDLLDRLRDRLDVLGAGGRDLPDRQRTLWGAIAWSYELLEPNEREIFELLSVFSPSELTSIETVLDDVIAGGFDLDALASLVDKSLIRRSDSGTRHRFSMLLMIKEFAAERLSESPTQEESVRNAHAEHFFELAQRLHAVVGRTPELDAVVHAAQHSGRVLHRLLVPDLRRCRIDVGDVGSLVVRGDLECTAGAGGCLLEDQRDVLARQAVPRAARVFGALEVACQVEQIVQIPIGAVNQAEQAAVSGVECHGRCPSGVERVAQDRTGHAPATAAAAAQFAGIDGDDLHPGLTQGGVGQGVAVVADDHARLERDHVVAVIPLFALDAVDITGGGDDPELHTDGVADRLDQAPGFAPDVQAGR